MEYAWWKGTFTNITILTYSLPFSEIVPYCTHSSAFTIFMLGEQTGDCLRGGGRRIDEIGEGDKGYKIAIIK